MTLKDLLGEDYSDTMTASDIEAKLSAKGIKLTDLSKGDYVSSEKYKSLNTNFEEVNKKLQAKMTDEEKIKAEQELKDNQIKELNKQINLSKYSETLAGTVSDPQVRAEIASLMVNGNNIEAINKLNTYSSKILSEKNDVIKALKNKDITPTGDSNNNGEITRDQFEKMSYAERTKLYETNIDLYKKLTKGN